MKRLILGLLALTVATMWLFNFSAGIVGGLWLFFTGGWGIVLGGLILSFIMPFVYSIAFLPQLLIAPLLIKAVEKGNRFLISLLSFVTVVYGNFLLLYWVSYVFEWMLSYKDLPGIALWLWAYSVVMSPISYMAAKEGSNAGAGTTIGLLFTQISFFIFSAGLLSGNPESGYIWALIFLFIFSIIAVCIGIYSIPKKEINTDAFDSATHQELQEQKRLEERRRRSHEMAEALAQGIRESEENKKNAHKNAEAIASGIRESKAKAKILLIQDDPNVNEILSVVLKSAGYSVETAGDGEIGLNKLENTYYDLVLLGILLRKVGGIEILKKIREKRVKQGKIIIFSNYTEENIIKEAIELGADGFKVMADVTPAELPELINDYLPGTISNKKGL